MRHAELPLVVLVLAIALVLRVAALSADAPGWLSWSAGIYSDEGIYSNDARMIVLDRQRVPGDFQISVVAPMQYHLLVRVFRRFGASLRSVRLTAVAFGMATLVAFWLTLRLTYDRSTSLAGLVLLSVSAPFVLYNRLGLLEMPALFWLTAAYLALAAAQQSDRLLLRLPNLVLAGALAGISVAWKGTFLLGAIPLLASAIWRHRTESIAVVCGAAATLGVFAVQFFLPNRAEMARVGKYYLERQYLPHSLAGVCHDLLRGLMTGAADGVLPYVFRLAPALLLFALCALLPSVRGKSDIWLWLWIGVPILAFLFSNYTPSRYFLIFWPALAALAARSIVKLPRTLMVRALALCACVVFDFCLLGSAYAQRTYTLPADSRTLAAALPDGAWVAGQFAPAMCLDNKVRAIYVQPGLANNAGAALSQLPTTHVLATRVESSADDPWAEQYQNLIAGPGGLKSLPVGRRFIVDLYANKEALP